MRRGRPKAGGGVDRVGQFSKSQNSLGHARGSPAQAAAQPQRPAGAGVRLRLHHVHALPVVHLVHPDAGVRLGRRVQLPASVRPGELGRVGAQSPGVRQSVYRRGHRARARLRDPDRSADSRRRRVPLDLSVPDGVVVHRHRHRLEVAARPGRGPGAHDPGSGLGELRVRLDQAERPGDLLRRNRRGVADGRIRDGAVSRRPAGSGRRAGQRSARGRRAHLAGVPARDHSAARAGIRLGCGDPGAHGDQVLRPGDRAHQRRAGTVHLAALGVHVSVHLHPQRDVGGRRERGADARSDRAGGLALPGERDAQGEAWREHRSRSLAV